MALDLGVLPSSEAPILAQHRTACAAPLGERDARESGIFILAGHINAGQAQAHDLQILQEWPRIFITK